jgi:DNA-binding protein HU-beta
MTKTDLVAVVAEKAVVSKAAAEKAVNAVIEGISGALKKGDKVTLVGFGTFEVVERAARQGVNPQTKKPIKIAATKAPKFKAGKGLKELVAGAKKKKK